MIEFQTPQISTENVEDNRGTFTIEPLDRGFGYTFGNSLRRVLLSSLAGAAVTSVRIEGVAHEFSTISGVKEDVTDIVLNLKEIVCRMHTDATEIEAPLIATGPGEVTAKDIDLPSGVEILNPDAHIATLEKKTKLELYLTIGRGRGYRPAEENKSPDQPIGVIPIDSIFSPVRRVAYAVEQARVGQRTDYDKLTLDIETDGSIDPQASSTATARARSTAAAGPPARCTTSSSRSSSSASARTTASSVPASRPSATSSRSPRASSTRSRTSARSRSTRSSRRCTRAG